MARGIIIEIFGDATHFTREMNKAAGKTRQFSRAAGVAGVALAGGLAIGLSKAAQGAMEDQVQTQRLATAFKNSGIPIKNFQKGIEAAQESGRKLGFMDEDVAQSIGSLVIATHSGSKAIKDLGVAEDIARFKHIGLEQATKMLTMAMAGSQRATKQLGLSVQKSTTAQDKAKQSYEAAKKAINDQFGPTSKLTAAQQEQRSALLNALDAKYATQKVDAKMVDQNITAANVIKLVTDKLHGQASAYAKTAAGGLAQYASRMDELRDNIGKAILPAFIRLVVVMSDVTTFFAKHETLANALVVSLGVLAATLITVSVATKLYAAGQAIATAATAAWTAAQWLLNAALTANPIGLVIVGLVALGTALVVAWQKSETFRRIVTATWDAVKTGASAVLDFFRSNWPIIATLVAGPFAPLVALATNAFGVRSALVGAFNSILSFVRGIVGDIAGAFETLPGKIGDAIGGAMHFLWDKLKEIFDPKEWAKKILGFLGFGSPSPFFVDVGKNIIESIAHGVGKFAGVVWDAVKKIVGQLNPFAGGTQGGGVSGKGGTGVGKEGSTLDLLMAWANQEGIAITSTTTGNHVKGSYHYQGRAIDVAGSAGQMSKFFLDTIKRFGVARITELFYDPMGYYIDNGRAVRGAIGGHSDHVHLALATGGIVTRPTMALIGEKGPEAVIPINRMNGGGQVFDITVNLDGETIYRNQKRHAARDVRRNGNTGVRGA